MREGWTYKKLGEVCELYQPQTISSKELIEDGLYPVYGANGVIGRYDKYNHEHSELLMTCRGATCGTINISTPFAWINGNAMVIHPKSYDITIPFLAFQLRGIDLSDIITGAAQPQITRQTLTNKKIGVPSLQEQQQIVSELDLLSSVIEKQKAQIEELDKLAQSIFYDMFGDPVENEKGWEVKKLVQVSSKITNGNTPKGGSDVYIDEGILFFRSQNVWRNRIDLDDIAYIDEETHKKLHNSSLMHNDILITKTGRFNTENSSLGRASLYEGTDNEANINGHVYLVRLKAGMIHKFVLYILISNSFRDLIRRVCVGGIDKRQLNKNHIEDFPIIIPPLSLQQEFANKIQSIESMKAKVRQSLKESEMLFNSRMDYYFN